MGLSVRFEIFNPFFKIHIKVYITYIIGSYVFIRIEPFSRDYDV